MTIWAQTGPNRPNTMRISMIYCGGIDPSIWRKRGSPDIFSMSTTMNIKAGFRGFPGSRHPTGRGFH